MNLIVDIGNTQTKVAVFNGTTLEHYVRISQLNQPDLDSLLNSFSIKRTIISCVGKMPFNISDYLLPSINVLELNSGTPIPIANSYESKSTLGADRLAAAVGAYSLFPGQNVLAIGCGTAITYDFVTQKAEYIGGAISPGMSIRFRALNSFTANLPLLEFDENFPILGQTTHQSIVSGVQNGIVFEIEGFISALQNKFSDFEVILTGGDANFFVGKLKSSIFVNPNLVLIGLNSILNYNE